MASTCGFPKCTLEAWHGGDFHVGDPVDPENPDRRYLYPTAAARARVLATLGPGPYVGVRTVPGELDEDAAIRKRVGLDELVKEMREAEG